MTMRRAIAISLKVPDNTAYTALVALRLLGVHAGRVERSEIRVFEDGGDVDALVRRIMADETIFNPNLHRLEALPRVTPREGEVWVAPLQASSAGPAAIAWRLSDALGAPVERGVLDAAIERLLCNPAIERAVTEDAGDDRDIPFANE
jgi:hypothetical protein